MKKNILASMFAVTVSLSLTQSALSQDVISEVKAAVVAEKADIAAVVKAAAAANPTQAAEIAQAAVKALALKSNDSEDEALIESIIQAAIEGAKAGSDQAKSIRAVAESALLTQDGSPNPVQGGDTSGNGNPLDVPGMDPLGNPLAPFTQGGTGAGMGGTNIGTGGGMGGGGLFALLGGPAAGAFPGGFFGATPGGSGNPGLGGGGGGGGLVNPPFVTDVAP